MSKKAVITLFILFLTSSAFAKDKIDEVKNLYMQGKYNQAYNLCLEALREDSFSPELHYYLGLCHLSKGNLNDAKVEFRNVITMASGTKLAAYSAQGIQNVFDKQNQEVDVSSVQIASSNTSSSSKSSDDYSAMKFNKPSGSKIASADGDSYFLNAVNNSGKLVRWDASHPINIYIPEKDLGYGKVVKEAFEIWSSAYSGFKFEYIKNPQKAHIEVHLQERIETNVDKYDKGGYADPDIQNGLLKKVDIHAETQSKDGKPLHLASFYNTMVHEVGHALGIWGHSDKPEDVMFPIGMPSVRKFVLSQRDKNTMKALYSSDADITNNKRNNGSSILSSDKKLKENAKEVKIAEAKKYVELMPEEPDNWVALAYTYESYGDNKNALENYMHALTLNENHTNALRGSASALFKLKKYPNAANVYKKLIKLEPKNIDNYNNTVACFMNMKKLDDAKYWLDKLLRDIPESKKDKTTQKYIKSLKK